MLTAGAGPVVVAVLGAGGAVRAAAGCRRDAALRRRVAAVLDGGAAVSDSAARWRARWRAWWAGRVVDGAAGRRWRLGRRDGVGAELWCLPAGIGLGLLGRSVLPVVAAVAGVVVVRRWLAARGIRRQADRRAAAVIALCTAVAGELRAGQQPDRALVAAGAEEPGLGEAAAVVLAAARYGGDVPGALRAAARLPGAEGLTGMAAGWQG
ncbi:hypothetical protein, partial [Streptomyces sp. CT34]|uniref:hypothetical protein n=1 Tax=Streptomyces sp. CT34 TaxID=1553907 RepID=UPI00068D7BA6